ncbi:MAG: hypothetical protein R3F38_02860 [Gammaproteobacteria bacterium]
MLRVRSFRHADSNADQLTLRQIEDIAKKQFPLATKFEINKLFDRLQNHAPGTVRTGDILSVEDFEGKGQCVCQRSALPAAETGASGVHQRFTWQYAGWHGRCCMNGYATNANPLVTRPYCSNVYRMNLAHPVTEKDYERKQATPSIL